MERIPFKLKGVYVRKLDPTKEIVNYEPPTKKSIIWKTLIDEPTKEYHFNVISFAENLEFKYWGKGEGLYCADFIWLCTQEIIQQVDHFKNRVYNETNFSAVKINESGFLWGNSYGFSFGNNKLMISGHPEDESNDIIHFTFDFLQIKEKPVREDFRYIPWI